MKRALSRKNIWEKLPTPLKRVAGGVLAWVPQDRLLGKHFRETLRFCHDSQRWSAEQNRAYQVEQLRRICTIGYNNTAFYRDLFDQAGFDPHAIHEPEAIQALPTINKQTVLDHLNDLCAVSTDSPEVDYTSTGGTSGVPLNFYINAGRSAVEYAYLVASWERAGFHTGMPMAVFRGRVVQPDRQGLRHEYDPALRYHYYSNFHMTEEDIRRYVDHIHGIGDCFLHVYPSSAAALARGITRLGIEPPANVRGLIAESEIVYDEQRELVEKVFGRRLFSCYGHTEKLVLTAECEESSLDHVWPTYGYFELIDEQGQPVTQPGQRGEIVGTGFINTVMPFIRYRTGDMATYVSDHCDACGRQHTVVKEIRGHRTQEMLIAADGSEISWTALNMHDDTFDGVRQFQFRQDEPGKATLRFVPGDSFGDRDVERMKANLGVKLAGRVTFHVEQVDEIALSPCGKAIYVDQRISRAPESVTT